MVKFDMGAAWDDSVALLKSHAALTGAIAAVFLFLPSLVVAWFGPTPIEPADGANLAQVLAALQENGRQVLPYQLGVALFALIGTIGILRLWLSRSGTSVGEALTFAAMLFPTMVAVQFLTGVMLALGFLLLIVPGLYLVGRLALVSAVVADRGIYNPIEAIRTSWALTRNNGWAIFFFLFLVTIVVVIAALIVGGVAGIVAGGEAGFGRMLGGLIEAAFGAVGSLVSIAISAAAYRQLTIGSTSDVFQ